MNIRIINTLALYRRLLAVTDPLERERLFREEFSAPFAGLAQMLGQTDAVAAFAMWGMPLSLFEGTDQAWLTRCIDVLEAAQAWELTAAALADAQRAFAPYLQHVNVPETVFGLFVADMRQLPFYNGGYSGFGALPGYIMVSYSEPTPYNLARIQACTAHEFHHNLIASLSIPTAIQSASMTATVGEYMIGEGLAESFAAELYGADKVGPWVTDFDYTRLAETKRIFKDALEVGGFDVVRGYIFGGNVATLYGGAAIDVPLYAGYALGYQVVQAYTRRTGKSVVEATFVPAREIIAESRFFDE
jgi:uncharacterized protein YjaZ